MSKFFTSNFTAANGTAITALTPPWVYVNGNDVVSVLSNSGFFTPGGGAGYVTYSSNAGSASGDFDIEANVFIQSLAGGFFALQGRFQNLSGTTCFYQFGLSAGGASMMVRTPSGDTALGSFNINLSAGSGSKKLRLTCTNGKKIGYLDGVPVITSTDNSLAGAAGNLAGMLFYSPDTSPCGFQPMELDAGPVYGTGAISGSAPTPTTSTISNTLITGDTGTYTAQFQRAPDVSGAPGTWANVGSAQAGLSLGVAPTNLSDSGLSANTTYWYRLKITYAADSIDLYSNQLSVTTPAAGSLTPGVTSGTPTSSSTATVSSTAASSGTAPYSYQFQRAPDVSGVPGTFINVGGARTGLASTVAPADLLDTGLSSGTVYWYRVAVSDSAAHNVNTTATSVTTPTRTPTTYYVSASGNNSNNGTSTGTPWQTISQVNTLVPVPGDIILFNGGDSFSGSLLINPTAQPTPATRITVGSYGSGRANILCGNNPGVSLIDCGYVTVRNINVIGPGLSSSGTFPTRTVDCTSYAAGIYLSTSSLSIPRSGIVIDNVSVTGAGAVLTAANSQASAPTAAYNDLLISNMTGDSCISGIAVYGNYPFNVNGRLNNRIRIKNCSISNTPGRTSQAGGTGFPIFIFNANDSVIENCVVHDAGDAQNLGASNGVAGIMLGHATNCVIRHCEAYNMFSPDNVDGNAFDFDADCANCLIEYCYGHDCDGAVMLLWNDTTAVPSSSGNVIRYNIFVNGGRGAQSNVSCCLSATPFAGNDLKIYNNVLYQNGANVVQTQLMNLRSGSLSHLVNNIFVVGGGVNFGTANLNAMVGNVFYVMAGSTFLLSTNTGSYTSLSALRSAGYEILNNVPVGSAGNPLFLNPGFKAAVMPGADIKTITAYDLSSGSFAIGAGVDPMAMFSTTVPADFHGNIAYNESMDAGPVRFGSTLAVGGGVAIYGG